MYMYLQFCVKKHAYKFYMLCIFIKAIQFNQIRLLKGFLINIYYIYRGLHIYKCIHMTWIYFNSEIKDNLEHQLISNKMIV